ncbi:hypothetical protein BT96DRAFT_987480 [Gymnopus androsaceus JB14]|uniref:Uncharacterized protein n=1 Tax=Gymnopus androsaceus JB14 TaxID=1447944 RepID=A0A6A4I923_9AGAR|nr:hypothetical protein BT96DRAFT_987480 [Gymnopus androsaceus JB14]
MIDSSSQAYKKARRQYLKTTRYRDPNIKNDWSPFRTAEKRFKAKFPPPDLTKVLDLATLDETRASEVTAGIWAGRPDAVETREFFTKSNRKGYTFPSIPGLVLLPAFLSPKKQRELVRWSLEEHSHTPNETNLDVHYLLPSKGLWKETVQDGTALVYPRPIEADTIYE